MQQTFPMVAKTFQGLEDVLRDELIALGAQNVEIGKRMVSFEGDLAMLYKANLCCRTAVKILRPIEKFSASDPDELYDAVRDIDWSKYMNSDSTFSIDSTVNSSEFPHSKFVTYRVKDGIADHFNDRFGRRPSIRVQGADLIFDVHISENRVTISLNSSGEPLSKRGYRVEQTAAPINEVLAAGIIMKTGWRGDCDFVDPMCGSGTFLIEAAMIAANINPGIYRSNFAFERWADFDRDLFESIYNDDSAERDPQCRISGGDIDPDAVAIARKNIREAHLEEYIDVCCQSFEQWTAPAEEGIIITNPPYGERLRPDDMSELFQGIGATLKSRFGGWHAWIIGYRDEHFASIGLKPSVKFPILNGNLECTLREYVLFSGKYSDFKTAGGSVQNEEFDRTVNHKIKHLSDAEWKRESRKVNRKEFKPKDFDDRDKHRDFKPKRHHDERDERREAKSKRRFDEQSDASDFAPRREYGDRDERRDFKPKRQFGERDERRDFKPKRQFGERDERRDFKPKRQFGERDERRDFKPKRQFGERDERRDFKPKRQFGERDERRDFKPGRRFEDHRNAPIEIKPKQPTISADKATIFSNVPIRSRRRKKPESESED